VNPLASSWRPPLALAALAAWLLAGAETLSARAQSTNIQLEEPLPAGESCVGRHPHCLCTEVCSPDAACVDGRCISLCSPSCREGTYCAPSSECLPLPQVERDEPTEGELIARRGRVSESSTRVASVDIGGVVFLGVRPTYEWGRHHAFQIRAQVMNTGFMTYKVEPQTEFEYVDWGYGASFGYRRYEPAWGSMRGFYYGGGVGYSLVSVRDVGPQRVLVLTHYPALFGEFGYRWVFDDFLFGFGPQLGVRVPVHSHFVAAGPGSCTETDSCSRSNGTRFEGTMVVEVGWFL
jgi:hypothetical protein